MFQHIRSADLCESERPPSLIDFSPQRSLPRSSVCLPFVVFVVIGGETQIGLIGADWNEVCGDANKVIQFGLLLPLCLPTK